MVLARCGIDYHIIVEVKFHYPFTNLHRAVNMHLLVYERFISKMSKSNKVELEAASHIYMCQA